MIYKKSHADQWCKPQIFKALNEDCGIIEIDVIYHNGEALLSHSWRPWAWMTYGNAYKYFDFCKHYRGQKTLYLMIDIKTTDRLIVPIIENYIFNCSKDKIIFLIRFDEKNKKRKFIAEEIYNAVKIFGNTQIYEKWVVDRRESDHEIKTKKLYKSLPWWKRIFHF